MNEMNENTKELKEEISRLQIYEAVIKKMCSYRMSEVDDYIRLAKQAVANYEKDRDSERDSQDF